MTSARNFFTDTEKQEILSVIQRAEKVTSGEIRVHLEETCGADVIAHAIKIFHKIELQKTALRNGVLIYLAVKDKQFAVIADEGINNKVPENFWDDIKGRMQAAFSDAKFLEGLLYCIRQAGEQLKIHFPISAEDRNEIIDDISYLNE